MEQKNKQQRLSTFFPIVNSSKNTNSPKEARSSSMTTTTIAQKIFWRPNNYRRKTGVKRKDNSAIKKIRSTIDTTSYSEHTKMLSIKNYKQNITIQYGKDTLTAIYSQNRIANNKEVFLIERNTIEEINEEIDKKKEQIKERMDIALSDFIKKFKIGLPLEKIKWDRYEDFIKGEDYIDKIPREVIVHDTFFKKVYGDGIEFKNTGEGEAPVVHMKNYIKNRAIEDISPMIAEEINMFHNTTGKNLAEFSEQIKLHLSVLNKIDKSFKKFNNLLSQKKMEKWM